MRRNKGEVRLYNALFPFWMLLLFPQTWLIVLPGNFIIDSAVFLVSLLLLKIPEKKQWYKTYIFPIYAFGMLSDIVGAAYMFLLVSLFDVGRMGDEPYLTIPALLISAVFIFMLNYRITFRKIDKKQRLTLSLIFAIVTAPYTFLIPTNWLY